MTPLPEAGFRYEPSPPRRNLGKFRGEQQWEGYRVDYLPLIPPVFLSHGLKRNYKMNPVAAREMGTSEKAAPIQTNE